MRNFIDAYREKVISYFKVIYQRLIQEGTIKLSREILG